MTITSQWTKYVIFTLAETLVILSSRKFNFISIQKQLNWYTSQWSNQLSQSVPLQHNRSILQYIKDNTSVLENREERIVGGTYRTYRSKRNVNACSFPQKCMYFKKLLPLKENKSRNSTQYGGHFLEYDLR